MREHGLVAKGTRKDYCSPRKGKVYDEKENVLNRVFSVDVRNKVWGENNLYTHEVRFSILGSAY